MLCCYRPTCDYCRKHEFCSLKESLWQWQWGQWQVISLSLWGMQWCSDPEHKNYPPCERLKSNKLNLWWSQSQDLNPTDMLQRELKKQQIQCASTTQFCKNFHSSHAEADLWLSEVSVAALMLKLTQLAIKAGPFTCFGNFGTYNYDLKQAF